MNFYDWVLLAVFALAAFYGYRTGLIQAVLNVAGVYVAMLLAPRFSTRIVDALTNSVESEALSTAIGYIIIFGAVIIGAQVLGRMARSALDMVFLGWVDKLGGALAGIVLGTLLAGALLMVTARYAYVFDGPSEDASLPRRLVEEHLLGAGRERLDGWMVGSRFAPVLLDVRSFLPGDMLGVVSDDFSTALDILEERIDDEREDEEESE